MNWLNFFDDVGILLLCRPVDWFLNLQLLNMLDDLGIKFVMKPLSKLDSSWPNSADGSYHDGSHRDGSYRSGSNRDGSNRRHRSRSVVIVEESKTVEASASNVN